MSNNVLLFIHLHQEKHHLSIQIANPSKQKGRKNSKHGTIRQKIVNKGILQKKFREKSRNLTNNNRKRREQDSNLRTGFAGYTLSRRASSTTRAPLLAICGCKGTIFNWQLTIDNWEFVPIRSIFNILYHFRRKTRATLALVWRPISSSLTP